MLIQHGNVLDFSAKEFVRKDLRIAEGKITEVGPDLKPLDGEEVVDSAGLYITPGLIDAHSHICISEESAGDQGDDCCDYSGPITPELEVLDGLYPFDRSIESCLRGGVTSACVCPGSDAVVGGVASVIQLKGKIADEMIVTRYAAMKCSLGENPKNAKYAFCSRMGVAYQLRRALEDAVEYKYQKELAAKEGKHFQKDIGQEHMLLVLEKKMPIHMHAHRSDDIVTAIRICQEYDVDLVIIHCTDGIPIADYLARFDYPAVIGPTMSPRSKLETRDKTWATYGVLSKAGVTCCVCSDHDVTHMSNLMLFASMAVRHGMDEWEAFKAVTLNPAAALRIADRKGDIRPGLDADVVLWDKHPFAYDSHVVQTYIQGDAMLR